MSFLVKGNVIHIAVAPGKSEQIIFPERLGYSIGKIIVFGGEISVISPSEGILAPNIEYTFPVVRGKSPCTLFVNNSSGTSMAERWVYITEFGGEPDIHYFDDLFDPILVKRKDVTEYNMIPTRNKGGV